MSLPSPIHFRVLVFLVFGIRTAGAAVINHVSLKPSGSEVIPSEACTPEEYRDKDIDVVVYGATGFTGRLAVEYISKWRPKGLRWAVAGRTAEKLEALVRELALGSFTAPSVLVADLKNYTALVNLTRRTRAIISYAGPYEAYGGEALIKAALHGCAHYSDLTGEVPWKVSMLKRYGAIASARGVAIVQSVGLDSLPSDVLAVTAAEEMAQDGKGPPDMVKILFTELNGYVSAGTLSSGLYMFTRHLPIVDPYVLAPETPLESRADILLAGTWPVGFDFDFRTMTLPYPLAGFDCTQVRRSLSLRFPGARIHVGESMSTDVPAKLAVFMADPRVVQLPMVLAKGEGPPKWVQSKGSFTVKVVAKRSTYPREVRLTLFATGDPGYAATAKMSAELTLGLALDGTVDGKGGYLTPAAALPPGVLQRRLSRAEGGMFMTFS